MIDARDAAAAEIRGWGRYTRELVAALQAGAADGPGAVAEHVRGAGVGWFRSAGAGPRRSGCARPNE